MFKKMKSMSVAMASCAVMFLASISISTNTIFIWHEIDCPEELLKE
ncbi:MAG: cyclic lactone autoinducer peptide [Clostridiales Family XIII bacterium]|nr:cyclic lactone autoinducer peptide [Clostridiales Family XIII bacterium]